MNDELATAMLEELKAIRVALENHQQSKLLTATEVARRLAVGINWVYAHRDELGAISLPSATGQKPRLRYDPEVVDAFWRDTLAPEQQAATKTRGAVADVPLLPVGGGRDRN